MVLGEKLWEERGKYAMAYISEIKADGVLMKGSTTAELKGYGRFPSGKNMGSGESWWSSDGKIEGWWRGMMMTSDGEMAVWKASGIGQGFPNSYKTLLTVTFMTKSEKYAWLNSAMAIVDIQGDMEPYTDIGYECKQEAAGLTTLDQGYRSGGTDRVYLGPDAASKSSSTSRNRYHGSFLPPRLS